jgi:hypothetical protein
MERKRNPGAGVGLLLCILLAAFLFNALEGCSRDEAVMAPDVTSMESYTDGMDPEMAAGEVVLASGWQYDPEVELPEKLGLLADKAGRYRIIDWEREPLTGDIVRYSYTVRVGNGEYENIRLHRVVKEREPYWPIQTRKSVFALHGVPGNFNQWFLVGAVSNAAPPNHGMAIYLAENDIDVWGMDQAYYLVPPATTDFSFMEDWGMQFDIDNLRKAMAIARYTRLYTGNNYDRMTLIGMGHGGGGMTGYAALNQESQFPAMFRHIGAFIPVSACYKTNDIDWQNYFCANAQNYAEMLRAGNYVDTRGQMFATLSSLALQDPEGKSPFVPGFTNKGAILFIASMTWESLQFPDESHYLGGLFQFGLPVDLKYSNIKVALEGTQQIDPFAPARYIFEVEAIKCDRFDLPFDDHLGDITVPVFAVCSGGFMRGLTGYTTTLLGSSDVTVLIVSRVSELMNDICILYISHGTRAPTLFCQPMLEWVEALPYLGTTASPGLLVESQ